MCSRYLQAVVTNNAEEGDDCVCYGQEMEAWLHVSATLLQNKINCASFIVIIARGV